MSTPLPIYGVIAPTGVTLRARVRNPDGTTNTEVALAEDGTGLGTYSGVATVTPVVDTSGLPYTAEVREVTAQTSGAFDASTTVRAAKQAVDVGLPAVNVTEVNGGPATLDTGGGTTGTGAGNIPLDHDGAELATFYIPDTNTVGVPSSVDLLQFKNGSTGISGLLIRAYLASEFDAGQRVPKGITLTGADGRWFAPLMLFPGTYYIVTDTAGDGFMPNKIKAVIV